LLLHPWSAAAGLPPRFPLKTSLPYPPVSVRQQPLCAVNSLDTAADSGFGGGGMCKDNMLSTAPAVGSEAGPVCFSPPALVLVASGTVFRAHTLEISEYIAAVQPVSSLQRATHAPGVAAGVNTPTPCSSRSLSLSLVPVLLLPPPPESGGTCAPQHPSVRA